MIRVTDPPEKVCNTDPFTARPSRQRLIEQRRSFSGGCFDIMTLIDVLGERDSVERMGGVSYISTRPSNSSWGR